MANEEHVERLKRGVAEWNAWHELNSGTADLSGADLSGIACGLARIDRSALVGPATSLRSTHKGKVMTDAVDAARERIGRAIFAGWDEHDVEELVRLVRKFADAVNGDAPSDPASAP